MKILYDLIATQPVGGNRFHGAAEYAIYLFRHLAGHAGDHELICAARKGSCLDESVKEIIERHGIGLREVDGTAGLPAATRDTWADPVYSALPYDFGPVLGTTARRIFGRLGNPERFIFHGYVERDILELLYSTAMCFVYPTLNEGSGYPPVEAMKYGTPVICSDASSVPEVCGDGALYFDPRSIGGIAARAAEVALDSGIREALSEAERARAAVVMAEQEKSLGGITSVILGEWSRGR